MKTKDIFKDFDDEYKWLTKDSDGEFHLWDIVPHQYMPDEISTRGWWGVARMDNLGLWVDVDVVDEFNGLDWKDCIIERENCLSEMLFDVGNDLILSTNKMMKITYSIFKLHSPQEADFIGHVLILLKKHPLMSKTIKKYLWDKL